MNNSGHDLYENLVMLRNMIDDFIDHLNQNKTSPPDDVIVLYVNIGPFAIDMEELYDLSQAPNTKLFHMDMETGLSTDIEELEDDDDDDDKELV